jgi:uncharacterized phage protein (predicted DNA packaging)
LRLDDVSAEENTLLETLFAAAKAYIRSYTGLDDENIDLHEDIVIVVYVLVQDMFDNRALYVDRSYTNRTVETILGMHRVDLL